VFHRSIHQHLRLHRVRWISCIRQDQSLAPCCAVKFTHDHHPFIALNSPPQCSPEAPCAPRGPSPTGTLRRSSRPALPSPPSPPAHDPASCPSIRKHPSSQHRAPYPADLASETHLPLPQHPAPVPPPAQKLSHGTTSSRCAGRAGASARRALVLAPSASPTTGSRT